MLTSQDGSQGTPLMYICLYRPTAACAHCAPILPALIFNAEFTTSTACTDNNHSMHGHDPGVGCDEEAPWSYD